MATEATMMAAAALVGGGDGNAPMSGLEDGKILLKGFFVKKPPKGYHGKKKRCFILRDTGLIAYYKALSPDNEPTGFKGQFKLFRDSKAWIAKDAKNGNDTTLIIKAFEREWTLMTPDEAQANEWISTIESVVKDLKETTKDHRDLLARRKMAKGGITKRIAKSVGGALKSARSTMQTFGFAGTVTVTGQVLGLSLSMSIGVEIEQGEGSLTIPESDSEDDSELDTDDPTEIDRDLAEDDDSEQPPDAPLPPEKESRLMRGLKKVAKGAMGRVKQMAFTMRKYNLHGSIGVGGAVTMFGTGLTIEFEIEMSSALTDMEFEAMDEQEKQNAAVKKESAPALKLKE